MRQVFCALMRKVFCTVMILSFFVATAAASPEEKLLLELKKTEWLTKKAVERRSIHREIEVLRKKIHGLEETKNNLIQAREYLDGVIVYENEETSLSQLLEAEEKVIKCENSILSLCDKFTHELEKEDFRLRYFDLLEVEGLQWYGGYDFKELNDQEKDRLKSSMENEGFRYFVGGFCLGAGAVGSYRRQPLGAMAILVGGYFLHTSPYGWNSRVERILITSFSFLLGVVVEK